MSDERIGTPPLTLTRREGLPWYRQRRMNRNRIMSQIGNEDEPLLTVSQVAEWAHVSVRTLHYYDEIGLLEPSDRSDAGYRQYVRADLDRLHEVLLFRELGLPLEAIRELVDAGAEERRIALLTHRTALNTRRRRTDAVIKAVDRAIEALERGQDMTEGELFEGFEEFDHARHAEEAEERWGNTEAYEVSLAADPEILEGGLGGHQGGGRVHHGPHGRTHARRG